MAKVHLTWIVLLLLARTAFSAEACVQKTNNNGIPLLSAEVNTADYLNQNRAWLQRGQRTTNPDLLVRIVNTLATSEQITSERQIYYIEDSQMYYQVPVSFFTNFPGELMQLHRLSHVKIGADRISTSFFEFCEMLIAAGYTCKFDHALGTDAEPPAGSLVVRGAAGNY